MKAIAKRNGEWVCPFCHSPSPDQAKPTKGTCRCDDPPRPGLGDHVASALSTVGITEERVSKALGRPCACKQRQQKMNDWGRKWLGIGGPG